MKWLEWLPRWRFCAGHGRSAWVATAILAAGAVPGPVLFEWERGFGLRIPGESAADLFLWVYEWNMFEAMSPGQHTHGTYKLEHQLDAAANVARVQSPALQLSIRGVADGAELELRVTNLGKTRWPEVAGIIPCWSPGQLPGTNPSLPLPLNRNFSDPWRRRSFFVSSGGLTPLASRALHFNAIHRPAAERLAGAGRFAFSNKWPTSSDDAVAGLLVRESEDGQWVTGVAWEDFLCVQGHNPWSCLHVGVRLGALQPNESRTVRGRLYLFRGTKEDCLRRFQREFSARK